MKEKDKHSDILIIGAGLTGLSLAYFLRDSKLSIRILEARKRLGGRILTLRDKKGPSREMGATWLGQKHSTLVGLLEELNIDTFEQVLSDRAIYEPLSTSPPQLVQLPPNEEPSFRIKGGSDQIIQKLAQHVPNIALLLEMPVFAIKTQENQVLVETNQDTFTTNRVVSTLPPFLLAQSISIEPRLPEKVNRLMANTHTWMGESIKIALSFAEPFWRAADSSGTIFSNVGPIQEFYDHSNFEDQEFALKGFLNSSYHSITKEQRLEIVLKQLRKYYGSAVDSFLSYDERVWRHESFTFRPYDSHILPHQNNGHVVYRQVFHDGKFFIAGSETAAAFPGYMDGAISSAKFVANLILKELSIS